LLAHLDGVCDLETAVERIKIDTRRFAKNQRTWLRRLRSTPGSLWLTPVDITDPMSAARDIADRVLSDAQNAAMPGSI
jgi:tRNA A37 N6-isopentenylltransferase MiaA